MCLILNGLRNRTFLRCVMCTLFLFHVTERRFFGVPPYLFWDFLNIFTEKDTEGLYEGKNQFVCVDHAGL